MQDFPDFRMMPFQRIYHEIFPAAKLMLFSILLMVFIAKKE